jgi:hypothetical protein
MILISTPSLFRAHVIVHIRNAYNMVINKFGDRLYNGLIETETAHLREIAAKVDAAQGEGFLKELKLRWEHHIKSMHMIRDILMVGHGLESSQLLDLVNLVAYA